MFVMLSFGIEVLGTISALIYLWLETYVKTAPLWYWPLYTSCVSSDLRSRVHLTSGEQGRAPSSLNNTCEASHNDILPLTMISTNWLYSSK